MASRKGSSAEAMAAEQPRDGTDFDPVYEWLNGGTNYLLRFNLPGFKKEDFRVHVDPAGRLTVHGECPADGGEGSFRLHKVFQLPPTSYLDGITGRFEGSVLTLTVPKLPAGAVAPPQAKEEEADDDIADKQTDQKAKIGAERRMEAARGTLAGRQREEEQPKAEATAAPCEKAAKREREDQDDKAKAEHNAKVGREAERRIEAARARLAAAEREREREMERIGRWKERAAEEGFKWAEAIGKNKEVIATAVAAFTLGVFISHKLFSRN